MSRVSQAGYEVWHVTDSRVVHLQGAATGVKTRCAAQEGAGLLVSVALQILPRSLRSRAGGVGQHIVPGRRPCSTGAHRSLRRQPIEDAPYLWRDMFAHGFSLPLSRA